MPPPLRLSLSPSVIQSSTPSSFSTRLQMANAILDVFFLHIKPEVTAAALSNQPQMCRHSYLTTRADGTLSEAHKKTSVVLPETTLAPPGGPLTSERQNIDPFAKFWYCVATYSSCSI